MSATLQDAGRIRKIDNAHHVHPWHELGAGDPDYMIATTGEGIHVFDADGRKFIDGPAGMWTTQIGYGRKEMAQAIAQQVLEIPYATPWSSTTGPAARLAAKLAENTPGDLDRVFFTTGGSTAVETALRFVHFYNNILGRPEKKMVIAREQSYHGSTHLSAGVSGKTRLKSFLDAAARDVLFIGDPNPYRRDDGVSVEAWCDARIAELEACIEKAGPERIAAYIGEPVMASGGVIVPPPGYHKRCLELCRKHNILYISDEVVTGFGRLGWMFASQKVFDITPDIITCAKGITSGYLPLGAAIVSQRLFDEVAAAGKDKPSFSHGFTYSGHPVCCAAGLKNIEIMERENIFAHVREVTPHFQARLRDLARHRIVGNARGQGLLGCIEGRAPAGSSEKARLAVDLEFGRRLDAECEARGLLVRPIINMAVFSPPLIITLKQIDQMFDIMDEALGVVEGQML